MKFLNIITALCATVAVALPLLEVNTGSKDLDKRAPVVAQSGGQTSSSGTQRKQPIQAAKSAYSAAINAKKGKFQALKQGAKVSLNAHRINQWAAAHEKAESKKVKANELPDGTEAKKKLLEQAKNLQIKGNKIGIKLAGSNEMYIGKLMKGYPHILQPGFKAESGQPSNGKPPAAGTSV